MTDYKKRFEDWQRQAKEKFDEIDSQFGLKEKLDESAKMIIDTAQKSADVVTVAAEKGVGIVKEGVEMIRSEAEKSETGKQAVKVAEETFKSAEKTAKDVYQASEPLRDVAEDVTKSAGDVAFDAARNAGEVAKDASKKAGEVLNLAAEKANEVFEDASASFKKTSKTASDILGFGSSLGKTIDSAYQTVTKTLEWVQENPFQAASTGVSMVVGAGLGAGLSLISSNWLFQSALPAWGVSKISEQFIDYLKSQEDLISKGELSEAEAENIQFEKEIVKYVGAPLMGAFSCAAGAMMWTQIFNPKTITGAPISWLLGGNPILEGIWLFGNGTMCMKIGVEFFMVSLDDHSDVQRMVREIKAMLPQPG